MEILDTEDIRSTLREILQRLGAMESDLKTLIACKEADSAIIPADVSN